MITALECVPCFVGQSLDVLRMTTDDPALKEKILRQVLRSLSEMDMTQPPPAMARDIHRIVREQTGNLDPYKSAKLEHNSLALRLLPELAKRLEAAEDKWEMAVRLSIAGNVIDLGVNMDLTDAHVDDSIAHAMECEIFGSTEGLHDAVAKADRILYLADNAGEIVFDRLLLGLLPLEKVTLAVKGGPIINDVTLDDLEGTGITEIVHVISNGDNAPGTILSGCSEEFVRCFDAADLVISKGQGNYETLSGMKGKDIFFLLKSKCPVISRDIGCKLGSVVVERLNADR